MPTVFNDEIDVMLLNMQDEEGNVYTLRNSCKIEDMIYTTKGQLEKDFVKAIEDSGLNLNQPVICHPRSEDNPFDLASVFMCKDFYISVGYYSAGSSAASAMIFRFKDDRYFDEDGEFLEMEEVFTGQNEGEISLF